MSERALLAFPLPVVAAGAAGAGAVFDAAICCALAAACSLELERDGAGAASSVVAFLRGGIVVGGWEQDASVGHLWAMLVDGGFFYIPRRENVPRARAGPSYFRIRQRVGSRRPTPNS